MKIPEESSDQRLEETHVIPNWVKATIAMRAAVSEIIEEHCETGHPLDCLARRRKFTDSRPKKQNENWNKR